MRTATIALLLALTAGSIQLSATTTDANEAYSGMSEATPAAEASATAPCAPAPTEDTQMPQKRANQSKEDADAPQNHVEYGAGG